MCPFLCRGNAFCFIYIVCAVNDRQFSESVTRVQCFRGSIRRKLSDRISKFEFIRIIPIIEITATNKNRRYLTIVVIECWVSVCKERLPQSLFRHCTIDEGLTASTRNDVSMLLYFWATTVALQSFCAATVQVFGLTWTEGSGLRRAKTRGWRLCFLQWPMCPLHCTLRLVVLCVCNANVLKRLISGETQSQLFLNWLLRALIQLR